MPIMNEALQLLDDSPIPKKKMRSDTYLKRKVDNIAQNLKRSLGVHCEIDSDLYVDSRDFVDVIDKLKKKYHEETGRSEKIQILTILPTNRSIEKCSEIMNATQYSVKLAKKLSLERGILATSGSRSSKNIL